LPKREKERGREHEEALYIDMPLPFMSMVCE